MIRSRGTALPETAVMLGTALTLLFGAIELGMFGYAQLSADGAAYSAAHATVLGNDPNAAVAGPFPQIAANGSVTTAQNNPTTTDIPVDYQVSNQNSRHGGVQVVRPAQLQATAQTLQTVQDGLAFPGLSTNLTSGFIEGSMQVSGHGYDIYGYDLNSQSAFNEQQTYFTEDGNAPPYFIGFHVIYACDAVVLGSQCPASNEHLHSMATAEYLDADNWGNGQDGVASGAVYQAMSYHYQVYENLGKQILTNGFHPIDPQGGDEAGKCIQTIHGWDWAPPPNSNDPRAAPLAPMTNAGGC